MWFDGRRQQNTLYVASVSRGKDSTAMLRAIQLLNFPLDAIVSADIWATDTIPAELPPMVEFKDEWDKKCLEWFGLPVTRLCAMRNGEKQTYEKLFYHIPKRRERADHTDSRKSGAIGVNLNSSVELSADSIRGFPTLYKTTWCKHLKADAVARIPSEMRGVVSPAQDRCAGQQSKLFYTAPERGAEDKYRSLCWNSRK